MAEERRSSLSQRELGRREGGTLDRRGIVGLAVVGLGGCRMHLEVSRALGAEGAKSLCGGIGDLGLWRGWRSVVGGRVSVVEGVGEVRGDGCLGVASWRWYLGDAGSDAQEGVTHCVVQR
jgi:hypothetical protein